ncbi:hypothetical protein EV361DRAFT_263764 [Lentinula raphanica]|uniref:Sc15 protein n=1 Tax=Lentinula raphanica TaxID=153919 RepID=A0AA38P7S8_9AGAR|nr:hypothetical protein F5880DRAFT_1505674 [Lentinula raphanica]KAJ3837903.1 hypothetical protein F5878DRAFT_621019 [Lentinula raphanica]KAJ3970752.1 hypothetical protein EV361DRAFT_263764 [Lentinula raphanica]
MFFARFFALFFLFASFGIVTSNATVVQKRQDTADVETVLNTLKSSTDVILPQITSVAQSGNVSDATVAPLINELTAALNTASSSLSALKTNNKARRQVADLGVAVLVDELLTDITTTLDGLLAVASGLPEIGGLFAGVDAALHTVLGGLETLLAGVLVLVATLLGNVDGLLRSIGFGLTLASLGL